MAGNITVANLNGVPPVQLATDEIVQADGSHIKNQCTAWVSFDGTTTPPTINDSFNVSDVVRTALGRFTIVFENTMDNANHVSVGRLNGTGNAISVASWTGDTSTLVDTDISFSNYNASLVDPPEGMVIVFGGRN